MLGLAARQHGLVTRCQLLELGLPAAVVDRWVGIRRIRPIFREVYLAGPVFAPRSLEMAAVLACGVSAVVSHGTAARLWRIGPDGHRRSTVIDIALPRGNRSNRDGIRIRRTPTLRPDEVTRLDDIPTTTPARTLLDLAGLRAPESLTTRALERAVAESLALRLSSLRHLRMMAERHSRHAGSRRLIGLLGDDPPAFTRSEAEERFLDLIRRAQLPKPRVNARIGGYEVDFFWPAEGCVAEIDGFAVHASRAAFEADRKRDAVLAGKGVTVIRSTWRQLEAEPEAVIARLALTLARRRSGDLPAPSRRTSPRGAR